MKVAMKGVLYDDRDVVRARQLLREFEHQGIRCVQEKNGADMTFRILVPDNVELTSDVYP